MKIGIIGLGLLGSAIAERFGSTGYSVCGYDADPSRCPANGTAHDAAGCPIIVLCLPDSDVTARVLEEIASSLRPGSIVLDATTGAPEQAERSAAWLAQSGVSYLEANVGGSSEQVRRAEAILICGGDPFVYAACAQVLRVFSRQTLLAGPVGSGNRMKLAMNLVLGLNRAALAEGLSFAKAMGLDLRFALEVFQSGPASSRVMDTKGEKMISGDFRPQARLSQHLKDVRLMLTEGQRCGAALPLTALHQQILQELEEAGFGCEDNSAVMRAFQPSIVSPLEMP